MDIIMIYLILGIFCALIFDKPTSIFIWPLYLPFRLISEITDYKQLKNKEQKLLESENEQYEITNWPAFEKNVWESNHGDGFYRKNYERYTLGRYLMNFSLIGAEEEKEKWNDFINKYKELLDEYKNKCVERVRVDKILGTKYIEVGDIILSSEREIEWRDNV